MCQVYFSLGLIATCEKKIVFDETYFLDAGNSTSTFVWKIMPVQKICCNGVIFFSGEVDKHVLLKCLVFLSLFAL